MKHLFIAILLCISSGLLAQVSIPQLHINEFMASNSSTIDSPDFNESADWVEIYNAEDTAVNMGGFYLTDDLAEPLKWQIPLDMIIEPGSTILFWADSHDEGLHTNFNLSQAGEEIGLFTNNGVLIDSIYYGQQSTDISRGRFPDGADDLFLFDHPTPGSSNSYPGFSGIVPNPELSLSGGLYPGAVSIQIITSDPLETTRFTTDGSRPNLGSPVYTEPIVLSATTVVRAQSFQDDYLPSGVVTHTYLINESTELPIVSVATDPANLWDDEIGIYVEGTNGIPGYCVSEPRNWNQPWERPVSLEMFEANGNLGFKLDAGMQIGGGCTRKYPEKTLAIYARSEYGASKINYQIFDDKPIDQFNNILLRNSGQDWWRAMFRDGMMQTLVKDQMDIDWQAYKPAILFLNGEYWGIHAIREKHNEHYLESNYGIDPDAIDILTGNATVMQGSAENYVAMMDFIESHDLSAPENYQWVSTQMDINEYLNYMIAEIYFANIDWPGGNIKYWREHGENNKWRWILFDLDLGFGAHERGQYDSNTLANATATSATYYANPPWSTFLFRKLLENADFRAQFIQRSASHLNITFQPERVLDIIDSLKMNIEAEIPRHIQKWEQSTSFNGGWAYHLDILQEFAIQRPGFMIDHLIEKFGLSGSAELNVTHAGPEMGYVLLNGVRLPTPDFSGVYLKDVPIQCVAVAKPGYRFVGWQGGFNSPENSMNLVLNTDTSLEAVFEVDHLNPLSGLRINELMALNEATLSDEFDEFDDWIELYNHGPASIDIGGLYVTDDLSQPDKWQIPGSDPGVTSIQSGGYLLLWADEDLEQGLLHLDLKLSGSGEAFGLSRATDSGFVFLDSVIFGNQSTDVSWGRFPDGENAFSFFMNPTPGYQNTTTGIMDDDLTIPGEMSLAQNYPNPFNPSTTIRYGLPEAAHVSLVIYDVRGQVIQTLEAGHQLAGWYDVTWNGETADGHTITTGIYFARLVAGDYSQVIKMLYLK